MNFFEEYKYIIDNLDNFQEQKMLKETETILAVLFRDYWATEEKRRKILEKEKYDLSILEKEQRKKYNPDDIFKKVKKDEHVNVEISDNNTNTALIEYKESFFTKFKSFIFRILHINN